MSALKFKHDEGPEDLMPKALAIPEDSSDEENEGNANPPMDGFAYLKSVIKERRRIPDTVTAKIDSKKIKAPTCIDTFAGCGRVKPEVPESYLPSKKWQNEQVSEFSDTRLKLNRHLSLIKSKGEFKPLKIPDKENEMLWCLFCFGKQMWSQISDQRNEENIDENLGEAENKGSENKNEKVLKEVMDNSEAGTPPIISVILSMPTHVVEQILEYQVSWVQSTGWLQDFGPWLYALLSRIEKPLTPDMGSILRDLALFCSQERSRLVKLSQKDHNQDKGEKSKSEEDAEEETPMKYEAEIASFNLFICLVAKYFNQGDLADV